MAEYSITSTPSQALVYTNLVYISQNDLPGAEYILVNGRHHFKVSRHTSVGPSQVAFNALHRRLLKVSEIDTVTVAAYVPPPSAALDSCTVSIAPQKRMVSLLTLDGANLINAILKVFDGHVVAIGQTIAMDFESNKLFLEFQGLSCAPSVDPSKIGEKKPAQPPTTSGIVCPSTSVHLTRDSSASMLKLVNCPSSAKASLLFKPDFDFESLGIGGLDEQFGRIFRRAFASRLYPAALISKLGIRHVKGIMLHGPPGTGKTLMARQIGKLLNTAEPKIINGPELLNKYVGQTEENVRALFADAEAEEREKGDDSQLHLIIFDEIDAMCKARGSTRDGTGVHDSVVNQLLSKIDGVESLNNVLLIGMTNRLDMIDEALLRPGRLEVIVEIALPDEHGRVQIFDIHTKKIRENDMMESTITTAELAHRSNNYTGAEIEGLVRSATSFAMDRLVDHRDMEATRRNINAAKDKLKVLRDDFVRALDEVRPAFGTDEAELNRFVQHGIIEYGPQWDDLNKKISDVVSQIKSSKRLTRMSVMLDGPPGAGKTALSVHMAKQTGYACIRFISGEMLIGYNEMMVVNKIRKAFEDATKSPESCIILDDLERLIEYVPIGPRFSNTILQTLQILCRKEPPEGKRLLVIATTSQSDVMQALDFQRVFDVRINIPTIRDVDALRSVAERVGVKFASHADLQSSFELLGHDGLTVKTIITILDLATTVVSQGQGDTGSEQNIIDANAFEYAYRICGIDEH